MNIAELLADDPDEEEAKEAATYPWPYPLAVTPQLLPGRTRRCAFWISHFVAPQGVRFVVDTKQLTKGARWQHNPAGDPIPEDALLVIIHPSDAEHIRKAMSTWKVAPHPAIVAARIIDSLCREDPTLAGRMGWKPSRERRA